MIDSDVRIYGRNLVCVCIDEYAEGDIKGLVWTPFEEEPLHFKSGYDLILQLDDLYDYWDFPQRTTSYRTFGKKDRTKDYHNPNSIRKRTPIRNVKTCKGEFATFLIQVQFRQHSSWQGQVLWAEKKKKLHFRSVLELMKLFGSVTDKPDTTV